MAAINTKSRKDRLSFSEIIVFLVPTLFFVILLYGTLCLDDLCFFYQLEDPLRQTTLSPVSSGTSS